MVLIIFCLLIGSIYIIWLYNKAKDKKLFFGSAFFVSLKWMILMVLISLITVNIFFAGSPEYTESEENSRISFIDSMEQIVKNDSNYTHLIENNNSWFNYLYTQLYLELPDSWETSPGIYRYNQPEDLLDIFSNKATNQAELISNIGYFGLGIYYVKKGSPQIAIDNLDSISDKKLAYLNLIYLRAYLALGNLEKTEEHFRNEFSIGEADELWLRQFLINAYYEVKNFDRLNELINKPEFKAIFPPEIAMEVHLRRLRVAAYYKLVFQRLSEYLTIPGILAALFIMCIWLGFLIRLDLFSKERWRPILFTLVLGMIFSYLVFALSDYNQWVFGFNLNGTMLNDFLYAVLGIGAIEELVKIIPLLLLISFTKVIDEYYDYLFYASVSALGFAFMENILYFNNLDAGIIHGRALTSVVGHMFDSTLVAYGIILGKIGYKKLNPVTGFILFFALAAIAHGIYDFLLFYDAILLFIFYYLICVQIWIILINNTLNNSTFFSYNISGLSEKLKVFLTLTLTSILIFEYFTFGIVRGSNEANQALIQTVYSGSFLVLFFVSNLSSFDLVKGYWRKIYLFKRPFDKTGSKKNRIPILSTLFSNFIYAHNYVGFKITIENERYNTHLTEIFPQVHSAQIIDRIILWRTLDDGLVVQDPKWFLVKLETPMPFTDYDNNHALIRFRYDKHSLFYDSDIYGTFRAISDLSLLKEDKIMLETFDPFGWIIINYQQTEE